ncbi:hypothetical protein DB30_05713 [Enhygromyxa salina]|uniref:Recombinase A n=1 Tax=Enhygromyxa salina TaxID=215803 RepID=A0A0C2CW73_9BACT|nr:hypothetical protein [Enhygromyxa salina]KIG15286.1 hypothetical protein DB30_05713 [Enhygromyxa salina]
MTAVKLVSLPSLHSPAAPAAPSPARPLAELAGPGRIVELCGQAQSSTATAILAHAQREGETAAWIQLAQGDLYPPDLSAAGVDIEALIVVHVPTGSEKMSGPAGQCRAAELLLRSGGFGLVILDFCRAEPSGSTAWQGRLLGLARQHEARVLILRQDTREQLASLGPLISMRVASRVERARINDDPPGFTRRTGRFVIHHEVLKNKSGGPLDPAASLVRGPWGLL